MPRIIAEVKQVMASFRCYDNSDVIATLIMTNFHLNTTVMAIFPNACLWRRSLYSNLVLTLKTNCIKPPSYVSTAYVVVIRPSFLSDSFVKIWATCEIFLGKWFTAPPGKKFPVRLCIYQRRHRIAIRIRLSRKKNPTSLETLIHKQVLGNSLYLVFEESRYGY